ncbi:MAG: molybdenum ABC transporter ATP-binding protein [Planctomycetota bacterium]|nr:MAG: molybdenum ABC transporter ATP-binding protein [Planctomycetota bacterium]
MIEVHLRQPLSEFELNVDFRSEAPVLGIFGRSGSGKSTLLHGVAGILRPKQERIVLNGIPLAQRPGGRRLAPEKRGLALIPQDPLLFPHLSTYANLVYAPGAKNVFHSERGRSILEVLRLDSLLQRNPESLSGGERQRVACGRALLAQPRMLLLDEPASSVDAELAREFLTLLLEAKRVLKVPMIFVTHRASELLALADDCLVLEKGRVVAQGPPVQVLARPTQIGIANLLGVDNLMRLPVLEHDPEGGISFFDLGGVALVAPLCAAAPGEEVDLGIYAEDLILCERKPEKISARNALPARISNLERIGNEFLVGLQIGRAELYSRVTPSARKEMDLKPGKELVVLIKTTACHLLNP